MVEDMTDAVLLVLQHVEYDAAEDALTFVSDGYLTCSACGEELLRVPAGAVRRRSWLTDALRDAPAAHICAA